MNTRSSSSPSSNTAALDDIDSILREVNEIDRKVKRTDGAEKALDNKGMTTGHWKRANKTEESFLNGLASVVDVDGNMKWGSILQEVPNPNKTTSRVGSERTDTVPRAFLILAGPKAQKKIELCNAMLCD